jgi:hypothetical protein
MIMYVVTDGGCLTVKGQKKCNRPANDIFFAPGRSGIMLPCMERR